MTSTVVVTPKLSQRLRASRTLITIALIAVISGGLFILIPQDEYDSYPLSPINPGHHGARALAQVLENMGADVIYAADATEAIFEAKQPNSTLVITHPDLLSSEIERGRRSTSSCGRYRWPSPGRFRYFSRVRDNRHRHCALP